VLAYRIATGAKHESPKKVAEKPVAANKKPDDPRNHTKEYELTPTRTRTVRVI
jgi:hypothetical protein